MVEQTIPESILHETSEYLVKPELSLDYRYGENMHALGWVVDR